MKYNKSTGSRKEMRFLGNLKMILLMSVFITWLMLSSRLTKLPQMFQHGQETIKEIQRRTAETATATTSTMDSYSHSMGEVGATIIATLVENAIDFSSSSSSSHLPGVEPQQQIEETPPPEDLLSIQKCSEKCKHIPEMCNGLYEEVYFPSPTCQQWSYTLEQDFYFNKRRTSHVRNEKTLNLYRWALNRTANRGGPQYNCRHTLAKNHSGPMMYPEEFEIITKTMINAKPKTYLEWGSGKSTSFFPLLVHGTTNLKAYVIDAYRPWCEIVLNDETVNCMQSSYLDFFCVQPTVGGADGTASTPILQKELGLTTNEHDKQTMANAYVNVLEQHSVPYHSIDVALVDGRFRVSCALKLLHYLKPTTGILFMHDFWLRYEKKEYLHVLKYYDVIGHARSVAVLRMKVMNASVAAPGTTTTAAKSSSSSSSSLPKDWPTAWKKYLHLEV